MAAERHFAEGFEAYIAKLEELKQSAAGKTIVVMFSGGKSPATGQSWCPDCVVAEPVVDKVLEGRKDSAVYLYCSVGGVQDWRDPEGPFRKDKRTMLKDIPTLVKIDGNVPNTRLVEVQCANQGLVEMLFED